MGIELDRVRDLVEEVVEAARYELVDLELKGAGRDRVLRVFVDKEGGISHRDCELISEQIGTILDVEDPIPFSYTLEISSPGLDRKLTKHSDFTRFQGRQVKVRTRVPLDNQKVFRGRLLGLAGEALRLEVEHKGIMEIPREIVREARLEVDWSSEFQAGRDR
jgi:ribosome maturation factor RimP